MLVVCGDFEVSSHPAGLENYLLYTTTLCTPFQGFGIGGFNFAACAQGLDERSKIGPPVKDDEVSAGVLSLSNCPKALRSAPS